MPHIDENYSFSQFIADKQSKHSKKKSKFRPGRDVFQLKCVIFPPGEKLQYIYTKHITVPIGKNYIDVEKFALVHKFIIRCFKRHARFKMSL